MSGFAFTLSPRPPFRLDLTAWALRRRTVNQTDCWDGSVYRRVFHIRGRPGTVSVAQTGPPEQPALQVRVEGVRNSQANRAELSCLLNRTLGLQVDLGPFYQMAAADSRLDPVAQQFRGMKPPRFPSMFEALLNAMSCQQVSLQAGLSILNRLATAYGQTSAGAARAFPRPEDLARADVNAMRAVGYSGQKGLSILRLVQAITSDQLDLEQLANLDDAAACAELLKLRGVGRWTAEYVLLRGLGRIHVFPADDVGARNNLREWLSCGTTLNYERTKRIVSRWHPYAGLLYFHLLLRNLAIAGMVV